MPTSELKSSLEGWCIPKNMKRDDGPRVFRLMGTRRHNDQTTWVLRMFTVQTAARRNQMMRLMYKRLARELRRSTR